MSAYKTGRSTDYNGSEGTAMRYTIRPNERSEDIIDQFQRMARGLAPAAASGNQIVWVRDDTLTAEDREWCWQTARMVEREAELAAAKRAKPKAESVLRAPTRTKVDIETLVARVLERYPDASANLVVVITGLQRPQVLAAEAWCMARMGKEEGK